MGMDMLSRLVVRVPVVRPASRTGAGTPLEAADATSAADGKDVSVGTDGAAPVFVVMTVGGGGPLGFLSHAVSSSAARPSMTRVTGVRMEFPLVAAGPSGRRTRR